MEFIHTQTRKGGLSITGMVSLIGLHGYEKGKKFGTQLSVLVEKEVDRAKKKITDERREFITKHDKECDICGDRIKIKTKDRGRRPIIDYEKDELLCQECHMSLIYMGWDLDKAEKIVQYLKESHTIS